MHRNVMTTPDSRSVEGTEPSGTNAKTARLENMPRVTRLTDMNEYANASKPDQPLTGPVAFRRNRGGAEAVACAPLSAVVASVVILPPWAGCAHQDNVG